ncbi:MAG: ACT domain-containing protein [Candidatus Korarchaeum sp.]|nr:ACT domain-containing protein [Candidatus Korarchaeum sp.]MDW8035167.1 V4R domain-containing protein [Candidatus Korarchaeum sp.]
MTDCQDALVPLTSGFKLPVITVAPGKDLVIIQTEIRVDRVGIIADISKEIAERKFNIISGVLRVEQGRGALLLVVERAGDKSLEDLREALSKIEGLGKVMCKNSDVPGLVIFTELFPLTRDGSRCIAVSEAGVKALVENLSRIIGEGAFNAVIFRIGYEMGKGFAEAHLRIARMVGIEDPLEVIRYVSVPLYTASGYGLASITELQGRISLRIRDNLEALQKVKREEPSCFLTKGMWKGVMESILKRAVSIEEVSCQAAGSDQCELEVTL